MPRKDVTLLKALGDYVLDIKPYHTKIKQFLSEIFFEDNFNVNIKDVLNWIIHHQNVWTRNDPGGYRLHRLCEGYDGDRTFRIPAAVWPRFSLSDNPGQTPPGDDPPGRQIFDPSRVDVNYIDVDDPLGLYRTIPSTTFLGNAWSDTASSAYTGIAGRYHVPFHQGSRVYVDGALQLLGTDYFVDKTRSFIQLAIIPGSDTQIDVQLMKVDRIFIAYNLPFDFNVNRDYDMIGYDLLPYDSDSDPSSITSDYFQFAISSSFPNGHAPVGFFNSVPSNYPKATLEVTGISSPVEGETWTITAVSQWIFKVERSTDPTAIWYATFKEPFDNGFISFIIDRVWIDYYIVGDNDSYHSYDIMTFDGLEYSQPLDETDFQVNLNLVTEHGVVTDPDPPIHRPMEFGISALVSEGGYDTGLFDSYTYDLPETVVTSPRLLGKVKKISQNLIPGVLDYYTFVLDEIPIRGTYVEFRIEQNGQLNPWLNATITDDLYLTVTYSGYEEESESEYEEESEPQFSGTKIIHNVMFESQGDYYVEPQVINQLVLYHNRGAAPSSVAVTNGGTPIPMTIVPLGAYFEGSSLAPDTVGVDKTRVIVNLATPQTIEVTLTF